MYGERLNVDKNRRIGLCLIYPRKLTYLNSKAKIHFFETETNVSKVSNEDIMPPEYSHI